MEYLLDSLPQDIEAEKALLSACILSPAKLAETRQRVKPSDFLGLANAHIYQALLALHDAGAPVDVITVADEVRRSGVAPIETGGPTYINEIALTLESAANAAHYADIVIQDSERRTFLRLAEHIHSAAIDPTVGTDELHARLARASEAAAARRTTTTGIEWITTPGLLDPVAPVDWKIPGLHLAPGRPCIIAGYGASMKTIACQSLAVSAAAGRPAWGHFHIPRPLTIRHIDAEQGEGATRRRYRRLAFAANIAQQDMAARLQLVSFPPLYLSKPGAEAAWGRVAAGADVVIVDSLRAMTPGVDENSSEMRRYLDPLTRISEATGAVFIIIHHAGKTPTDPQAGRRESRQQIRGSSGIFDAAGSVFLLSGANGGPRKVEQVKAPADAEGGAIEPFWLSVEDVPGLHDEREGVLVSHHATDPGNAAGAPTARLDAMRAKIRAVVQERPGVSSRMIVEAVGGRASAVTEAVNDMVDAGELSRMTRPGKGGGNALFIV